MAIGGLGRPLRARAPQRVLAIAGLLLLGGCKTDLYSKLQEREANLIVATLLRNGLPADRVVTKDGSSTVRVEESGFAAAVTLLNAAGLPRAKFQTMAEIFPSEGLVASPTEERARFIFALSQELARTVSEIDGVISARVHVVLPKNDPLRQDQMPSSASVFIKHDRHASVIALLPQIKTLIANGVEGLTYDKVSVVFVPADAEAVARQTVAPETTAAIGRTDSDATATRLPIAWPVLIAPIGLIGAAMIFGLWHRLRRSRTTYGQPSGGERQGSRETLRVAS
ncbi:type III secretion system inner membrane ring lipoprotein SctJ [Bradyrhizobium oligotrophicum]|uniref:type III secretion system inner membrane ring lipoprotein SctJ n=1 Tax=Bradyrhizobium oligotrophicum TaxID=44255 RepID=UPI003EBC1BEB